MCDKGLPAIVGSRHASTLLPLVRIIYFLQISDLLFANPSGQGSQKTDRPKREENIIA
jgi:hypothetical protein